MNQTELLPSTQAVPDTRPLAYSYIRFSTPEQSKGAIAFIRAQIGPCDDEGNINLITEGTEP